MKEENFAAYLLVLGIALLFAVQLFPTNTVSDVKLDNVTVKINPKVRVASNILPLDKSKPYSQKKPNYKFATVLQYINKNKEHVLPEINKFKEARKEAVLCLALNIYHEARGSSTADQKAVGYVTMNRIKTSENPTSECEVVWKQSKNGNNKIVGQFSWTIDDTSEILPKETDAWKKSQITALEIFKQKYSDYYDDFDITNGATHFYAPKLCKTPAWAKKKLIESKQQIGSHVFIKLAAKD